MPRRLHTLWLLPAQFPEHLLQFVFVSLFKLSMHVISDLLLGTFYDMEPFQTHKTIKSSNSNIITNLKKMPVKGFITVLLALKKSCRQGQEAAVICTYHLFSMNIAWHLKCVCYCRCTDLEVCV